MPFQVIPKEFAKVKQKRYIVINTIDQLYAVVFTLVLEARGDKYFISNCRIMKAHQFFSFSKILPSLLFIQHGYLSILKVFRNKYFYSFIFFLAFSPIQSQVIIEGKILHYDGKDKVYYHPTIEGIYTPYWEELYPNADGTFTIQFNNKGFGTTTVSFQSLEYRFFHDTNAKIYFEIDQDKIRKPKYLKGNKKADRHYTNNVIKQVATVEIRGDYQEVNQYYNRQLRTAYFTTRSVDGSYLSKMIYQAGTPERVNFLLDSLMQQEFEQIENLSFHVDMENPESERREKEVKEFLKNEVQAFYGGIFLSGMFLKRKEHVTKLKQDSTSAVDIYNRNWEKMIEDFAYEAVNNIAPTPNSADYMDLMESLAVTLESYQEYDVPKSPKSLDEYVVDRLFNYDTVIFSDEQSALAYTLSGLQRFLMDQLFYSPILLHAAYDLKKKYPGSKNIAHYEPLIEKLESYLKSSQESFNEGQIIRKNYTTLEDLLARFEGKNVLVDIWATWCHPCIEEFEHKDKIQHFVDEEQLELLYISIDKPEWKDRWKQSIKFNQLSGYHFRADKEFILDMWDDIEGLQGAIPRYFLVNKEGKIVVSTAARPSEHDELVQQINQLLAATRK